MKADTVDVFSDRREQVIAQNEAAGLTVAPDPTVRWVGEMQVKISAAKAKLADGKKAPGKALADALAAHLPSQPAAAQSAEQMAAALAVSDAAHAAMDDFNFGFDSPKPAKADADADPVPDQAPAKTDNNYLVNSPELSFLTGEGAFDEPAAAPDPVTESDEDPFAALDAPIPGIPASNKIPQRVKITTDQLRPKQSIGDSMARLNAIRKRNSGSGSDPT
jgi:hypothetical protein